MRTTWPCLPYTQLLKPADPTVLDVVPTHSPDFVSIHAVLKIFCACRMRLMALSHRLLFMSAVHPGKSKKGP